MARLIRCTMESVIDDGSAWKGSIDEENFDIISSCVGDDTFDVKPD